MPTMTRPTSAEKLQGTEITADSLLRELTDLQREVALQIEEMQFQGSAMHDDGAMDRTAFNKYATGMLATGTFRQASARAIEAMQIVEAALFEMKTAALQIEDAIKATAGPVVEG
jgi:hypothetical protein